MAEEVFDALQHVGLQPWSVQIVSDLGLSCLADLAIIEEPDVTSLGLKPVQKRKLWRLCVEQQEFQRDLAVCGHLAPVSPATPEQRPMSDQLSVPSPATPEAGQQAGIAGGDTASPEQSPQSSAIQGHAEPDAQGVSPRTRRRFAFQGRPQESHFSTTDGLTAGAQNPSNLHKAIRLWEQKENLDVGRCEKPWKLKTGAWATSARCLSHDPCRAGSGKRFRIDGQWREQSYILNVLSSGECHGGLTVSRKRKQCEGKAPLTRQDRQLILKTQRELRADGNGDRPTPSDVAAKLGSTVLERLPASSLRAVLRGTRKPGMRVRMRPRKKRRTRGPVSWTGDLERLFAARQDPDRTGVCCTFRELGPEVTSFVLIAPPFFRELEKLRDAGVVSDSQGLVGSADVTFEVEWQQYRFHMFYFHIYRNIDERWRKTSWSAALLCHPRELNANYDQLLGEVDKELERRKLPRLVQVHTDYFKGLAPTLENNGRRVVQDIWHLVRRLRANQRTGSGGPKLQQRPIGVPIAYVKATGTVPSKTMVHVFWTIIDKRARSVWRAVTWAKYFQKEYMREKVLSVVDSATYGTERLLTARWHSGVASGHIPGHGSDNPTPESGHSHFKDRVASARNLTEVVVAYEEAVTLHTSPVHGEERGFTRLAAAEDMATSPNRPDAWMKGAGLVCKTPWMKSACYLPGIKCCLLAFQKSKNSALPTIARIVLNEQVFMVMRVGNPRPIRAGQAQNMVKQLRTRHVGRLEKLWRKAGIVRKDSSSSGSSSGDSSPSTTSSSSSSSGSDAKRIRLKALRRQWGDHCVTWRAKGIVRASCWYFAKRGHCVHAYCYRQLELQESYVGVPVAHADIAALADRNRQAEPAQIDRSVQQFGRHRPRYLLGNKAPSVPDRVRTVMEAMAAESTIPVTTLRQRNACSHIRTEATVPDHLRDAYDHGYIHPGIATPAGYVWTLPPRPAGYRRTYVLQAAR